MLEAGEAVGCAAALLRDAVRAASTPETEKFPEICISCLLPCLIRTIGPIE